MIQPLPPLNPFIKWCGKVNSILKDLNILSSPPFFDRSIYGAAVSAEDAISKVDSLKCLAITLEQYRSIANYFEIVNPRGLSTSPSAYDDSDLDPTAISNAERIYGAVDIVLQEWKAKNRKSASSQRHKHFQLMHIGEEFFCLRAETQSLRNLFVSGSAVLSNPTSHKHHNDFDKSLRCIVDLHRSECGDIRMVGIRGGTPFSDVKIKAYVESCRDWAHISSVTVSVPKLLKLK